ncbi:MAG: hypothetical protein ABDI19_00140 [Armatimonadota bacterium]
MRVVWGLLVVALLVGSGLLVHPATAPYLRWKLATLFQREVDRLTMYDHLSENDTPLSAAQLQRIEVVRKQFPNDFNINWAAALAQAKSSTERTRQELSQLAVDFGDRPEVYAGLIRNECRQLHLGRAEEGYFEDRPRPISPARPSDRQAAQRILEWARRGEQLDAQNSFFSAMRAIALLVLKRDEEAIRALKSAARKPKWDDYLDEEVEAQVRFMRLYTGGRSADMDYALKTAALFPHISYQRLMARVMVVLAAAHERQGRIRDGLAIRLALAEYSGRLRSKASWLSHALTSVSITEITSAVPGGEKVKPPLWLTAMANRAQQTASDSLCSGGICFPAFRGHVEWQNQRFLLYLKVHGFEREAHWFAAEYKRADAMFTQTYQALKRFNEKTLIPLIRRYYWWLFGFFFTLGLLWCLGWMWLALGVAARWHLSLPATLMIALAVMLLATIWFAESAAAELMWRARESARAAESGFREGIDAYQEAAARLARSGRWGLPFFAFLINGLLLGLGLLWLAATRRLATEQSVPILWRFATVVGLVFLLALNGLMIAQVHFEKRLEQFAAMMRQNEVQLYLQGKRVPFEPPPR